jgi:hypothetical protein
VLVASGCAVKDFSVWGPAIAQVTALGKQILLVMRDYLAVLDAERKAGVE